MIVLKAIAVILTAATMTAPTTGTVYPETLYVTEITGDTVTARTFSGVEYQFTGAEDWQVNDIVSAIMHNNSTTNTILDDYFVDIRYSGYIE